MNEQKKLKGTLSMFRIDENCRKSPLGWRCCRPKFHDGPCALYPRIYNIVALIRYFFL